MRFCIVLGITLFFIGCTTGVNKQSISVSDHHIYLARPDGTPFPWIGETALTPLEL